MNISILLPNGDRIDPGGSIPINFLRGNIEFPSDRIYCHFSPANPDEIEGEDIFITGQEYIINHRKYNLLEQYTIKAKLTKSFNVIPILRKAVGKETKVIQNKDKESINQYWPIITSIKENYKCETENNLQSNFIKEAIDILSEVHDISETFDISNSDNDCISNEDEI